MPWPRPNKDGVLVRGRSFGQRDLILIRKLIRSNPTWGRTRLSEEVCRTLSWLQENGRLKDRACRVALLKLEALGYLKLPGKKIERGGQPPRSGASLSLPSVQVTQMPRTLTLQAVTTPKLAATWNTLVAGHHYLGLATPVGRLIRYLIQDDEQILGAISFSEAAWSVSQRDTLLKSFGISANDIRNSVICNNRFLILPHVRIKNLASRTLSMAATRVATDWAERFGLQPSFIETFVDPTRFSGTCYLAANWTMVGSTRGYSKNGNAHHRKRSPKLLFLYGIGYDERDFLQMNRAKGTKRVA